MDLNYSDLWNNNYIPLYIDNEAVNKKKSVSHYGYGVSPGSAKSKKTDQELYCPQIAKKKEKIEVPAFPVEDIGDNLIVKTNLRFVTKDKSIFRPNK